MADWQSFRARNPIQAVQWHGFKNGPDDLGIIRYASDYGWLHGPGIVHVGDWLVKDAAGRVTVYHPDTFDLLYTPDIKPKVTNKENLENGNTH